jgi:cytochrome P450 family 144
MLALDDPYPFYAKLRETDPVHRVADSDFYLVSTWELVNEAVTRPRDFSSNLTASMVLNPDGGVSAFTMAGPGDPGHVLGTADDPIHAVHRKMVLPTVVAKRIRSLEPLVAETVDRLWSEGLGDDGSIDWVAAMANRLPMTLVSRLIGLPSVDMEWIATGAYATAQMLDGAITPDQLQKAIVAATELAGYLAEQFARARNDPGENLLGDFARHCNAGDLPAETAVIMLIQLVSAGGESTTGLLGSSALMLAGRADIANQLRDNIELLPAFIEEVVRLESPFRGHYRHVLADTTLGGVDLPGGSHLLLLWGSANRDPAAFDAPDELRLDRPSGRAHLGFGRGDHFCVGAALARLEAKTALTRLLSETSAISTTQPPAWIPSVMVRRLQSLPLEVEVSAQ